MSKYRVPRKIKKKIPKGVYCYEYVRAKYSENGNWTGYETKPCPYGKYIQLKDSTSAKYHTEEELKEYGHELVDYCKIAKCEIDDQCKMCGIKEGLSNYR
jgi:hypothetical protein